MGLTEDLQAKRPGEWTQDNIDGLKRKYSRIHFDHFHGLELKPQKQRMIGGVLYVWKFGKWRKANEDSTSTTDLSR